MSSFLIAPETFLPSTVTVWTAASLFLMYTGLPAETLSSSGMKCEVVLVEQGSPRRDRGHARGIQNEQTIAACATVVVAAGNEGGEEGEYGCACSAPLTAHESGD